MTTDIERHASTVGIGWDEDGQIWESTRTQLERFAALVRAEALEEAAKACDVTPPYPFRHSIEAAHAVRAMKDKP